MRRVLGEVERVDDRKGRDWVFLDYGPSGRRDEVGVGDVCEQTVDKEAEAEVGRYAGLGGGRGRDNVAIVGRWCFAIEQGDGLRLDDGDFARPGGSWGDVKGARERSRFLLCVGAGFLWGLL